MRTHVILIQKHAVCLLVKGHNRELRVAKFLLIFHFYFIKLFNGKKGQ